MKKQITYIYEQDNSRSKDFLLSLINKAIILLSSFAIYFAAFYPIKTTKYKVDSDTINETKQTMLDIGLESRLMHSDNNKSQVFSLTNSYKYYVWTLLRYDYENSDYDLDTDIDNFKSKQPEMDLFPAINGYDDDFFGYFYISYIADKNLVDYQGKTPIEYFKYEILDIDSGKFFVDNGVDSYPHLIPKVRTALFNYVVMGSNVSSLKKIDSEFFAFFSNTFEEAGNVLLKYTPYKEAYDSYNKSFDTIYKFDKLSIYLSFVIPLLIVSIIIPLLNKHHQNASQLILKRVDLSNEQKVNIRSYVTRMFYDLFRNFPTIIIIAFVVSQNVLFDGIFYIGVLPISLFFIALILTMLNIVSLFLGLIRKDYRNLCSIIGNSDSYYIKKIKA